MHGMTSQLSEPIKSSVSKRQKNNMAANSAFQFCNVCRRNHNLGRKHIYSKKHCANAKHILNKYGKKVSRNNDVFLSKEVKQVQHLKSLETTSSLPGSFWRYR
jgi:hypothetical protein